MIDNRKAPSSTLEKVVFKSFFSQPYQEGIFNHLEKTHGPELIKNVYDCYLRELEFKKYQIETMKEELTRINNFFLCKHSKNPIKRLLRHFYFKKRMRVDYESEFLTFWSDSLDCSPFVVEHFLSKKS